MDACHEVLTATQNEANRLARNVRSRGATPLKRSNLETNSLFCKYLKNGLSSMTCLYITLLGVGICRLYVVHFLGFQQFCLRISSSTNNACLLIFTFNVLNDCRKQPLPLWSAFNDSNEE